MDLIILVVIGVIFCCMSVLVGLSIYAGVQYSYGEEELPKWKCTRVSKDKDDYIVSRIRNKDAECISTKDSAGCFVIKQKYVDKEKTEVNYVDLHKQCSNITKNFPKKITINGKDMDFEIFTCGEAADSSHFKLFKTSGYDDPENDCAIIMKDRSA